MKLILITLVALVVGLIVSCGGGGGGGDWSYNSSPAAAPQSPSRNQPTAVQQRQVPTKKSATTVQQRQVPTKKSATAVQQSGRSREATNVPGKVSTGQVAGRISRMADISVSPGSSQSITVTFQNTSDVTTHYRLEDAGRFSGWTITRKCREGPGSKDCEVQNVGPGDTVALNYQVSAPSPAPVVIYDDQVIIEENTTVAFQLDAGTYRLELTATGDGVEVLWPGSDCSGQPRETQSHTEICTLKRPGQFSVSNPSMFGAGRPSSFTVKVTNLPGGSATADWVLKAAHTCGLFGCRYQDVDSQSQLFSLR